MSTIRTLFAIALCLSALFGQPSHAQNSFELSGFATIGVGKVISACPCFWSDYGQAAVYENRGWLWKPQSKLGVQFRGSTDDQKFSVTGQAVSRGINNGKINVEWLYASANIASNITVQAGKQRIPFLQYSDVQDVGFALPWVHLPPQVYGWEAVNYQGANVRWNPIVKNVQVSTNAFFGSSRDKDAPYQKTLLGKNTVTQTRWLGIRGLEAKVDFGALTARAMALNTRSQYLFENDLTSLTKPMPLRARSLGISFDKNDWFGSAETLTLARGRVEGAVGREKAYAVHAGHRNGKFTQTLSYSHYEIIPQSATEAVENTGNTAFVLRYDLSNTSSVKVQIDRWRDKSSKTLSYFHGNVNLLSLSYDLTF
jgi:Gram-negative porin